MVAGTLYIKREYFCAQARYYGRKANEGLKHLAAMMEQSAENTASSFSRNTPSYQSRSESASKSPYYVSNPPKVYTLINNSTVSIEKMKNEQNLNNSLLRITDHRQKFNYPICASDKVDVVKEEDSSGRIKFLQVRVNGTTKYEFQTGARVYHGMCNGIQTTINVNSTQGTTFIYE